MITRFLQRLPLLPLAVAAVFLGLAPFVPQPHLLEKLRWLAEGRLQRPLDIFDLCFHLLPSLLLAAKLLLARR